VPSGDTCRRLSDIRLRGPKAASTIGPQQESDFMTLYAIKPRFQALLRPAVGWLCRRGITANQVTVFACAVSVMIGVGLALNTQQVLWFWFIPVWMLLRMGLNAIDGMLAREFGQQSVLGAYLNELTDVVADAALFLPFALLPHFGALGIGVVIVLAVISEMAGVVAAQTGASRRYDGPFGKSDRALAFGVLGAMVGAGMAPQPWMAWLAWAMAALLAATIVNRVRGGLAELGSKTK
jgi:CDP-diacylglycerol--glycerol-3-phosphate 3-phosphatidyltransferase